MKNRTLTLIKNDGTTKERIQSRIDDFVNDIYSQDGGMDEVEDVLIAIQNYLAQFEDEDLYHSAVHLRQSIFYIASFLGN